MPPKRTPNYKLHEAVFLATHCCIAALSAGMAVYLKSEGRESLLIPAVLGGCVGILIACYRGWLAPGDLTDWQIAGLKEAIVPLKIEQVEPDSYDISLGDQFHQILPNGTTKTITADEIIINPGECWLAHTEENFNFPKDIKGTLQGKSSWARLSLFVECAGLFDKGFRGTAVLELHNAGTWGILLKKGDRIAQMSFHRTLPACAAYGDPTRQSHYQNQTGAKESWLAKADRIIAQPQTP